VDSVAVPEEAPEPHMEEEAEVASMVAEVEALEAEVELLVDLEAEVVAEVLHVEEEVIEAAEEDEVAEAALAQAPRCSCKPMKDLRVSMFYVERTMLSLQSTRLQANQFTTRRESAQR